jgi:hypothetical protein
MFQHRLTRRRFLAAGATATGGLAAFALAGCDGGGADEASPSITAAPVSPAPAESPTPVPAIRGTWSRIAVSGASPPARRDHSLTFDPDRKVLYLFGGRSGGQSRNDFWFFNPAQGTWTELSAPGDLPAARFGHNAHYDQVRRRLVVALGQGDSGFFNDVFAFDTTNESWARLNAADATAPEARYGAASAYDQAGNRIFISHGFTSQGRFDDTWICGLQSGQWTKVQVSGDLPVKRCLTRAFWYARQKQMLMFGGQTDAEPFLGDFWALSVDDLTWVQKQGSPLPSPRNLYGADISADGGTWFVLGGNTPSGPVLDAWAYGLLDETWRQVQIAPGEAPAPRYSHDAAFVDTKLHVFGGYDGASEVDDLWALDIASG